VQQLQKASKRNVSAVRCATAILEAVPVAVQFLRTEMRSHRGADLSVPQFRALALLGRSHGASLSLVADFLGLSLPATSRLVNGLVADGLVTRRVSTDDRRQVALSLTARGRATWDAAHQATLQRLATVIAPLSAARRGTIEAAMHLLRDSFQQAMSVVD